MSSDSKALDAERLDGMARVVCVPMVDRSDVGLHLATTKKPSAKGRCAAQRPKNATNLSTLIQNTSTRYAGILCPAGGDVHVCTT